MTRTTQPEAQVNVAEFRRRVAEFLRQVEDTAIPVTISRRGRPIAQLVPLASPDLTLEGSVVIAEGTDLTEPVVQPDEWIEA